MAAKGSKASSGSSSTSKGGSSSTYGKLIAKGMSPKQAAAFAKNAGKGGGSKGK